MSNSIKTYAEAVAAVEASTVNQIIQRVIIETLNDAADGAKTDMHESYSVSRQFSSSRQEHQFAMNLIRAIDLDAITAAGGTA